MNQTTCMDWKRFATFALGLGLAASLATGCSDSATGTSVDPEGTYTLQTVNGNPVPTTLFELEIDGVVLSEVLASGQIQLAGGTYSGSLTLQSLEDGVVVDSRTDAFSGNYTVSGNTVILEDGDGEEDIVATFTATTLTATLEDEGFTFTLVFAR